MHTLNTDYHLFLYSNYSTINAQRYIRNILCKFAAEYYNKAKVSTCQVVFVNCILAAASELHRKKLVTNNT